MPKTVKEAAAMLGLARPTVQNLITTGKLPAKEVVTPVGKYYEIDEADIAAFVRQPRGRRWEPRDKHLLIIGEGKAIADIEAEILDAAGNREGTKILKHEIEEALSGVPLSSWGDVFSDNNGLLWGIQHNAEAGQSMVYFDLRPEAKT